MSNTKSYMRMHVQYTGTLVPLQYLITSYDTGTRPHILQRQIEATIYNDESSKYGSCVTNHNIVLCNLGYKCEPKVFIEIQRNQYNPSHVNKCAQFKHGKDSTNCHVATFHTPRSHGRNIQATRCVLGGKSRVKAVTLFLTPPFRLNS